ncbi:peptidoglycan DD-metalloendopeptidase family protein [Paenibacillus silvae]|jgi:stage IV sporulation protein FA|uniref:M23 family metallopeptidase n=1 Tax=Paenibacillus silvae TaxID=1325358 RepID=UPI0025A2C1C4|nr:M23 family metallopeptidase [Paenibacillus silvae]MDM5276005.1 M23 family metallopeptidase [Paenibacillus silvae]
MNTKRRIKQRREERIRRLMDGAVHEIMQEQKSAPRSERTESFRQKPFVVVEEPQERDPEWLWKKENSHYGSPGRSGFHILRSLLRRTMVSAIIFAGVWGLFQLDASWTITPKTVIADALHNDMDFAAAAAWYERNFGGPPSFLPVLGHTTDAVNGSGIRQLLGKPVSGTVVQPFALSMKGIEIVPDAAAAGGLVQVVSSGAGRVLEVLGDVESGYTVVIQHTGKVTAIYGRLNESELQKNDWVEVGDTVGTLKAGSSEQPATLYFAIKEGEEYVDPAEVVALD